MQTTRLEKKRIRTLLSDDDGESVGCSEWSDHFWQQLNDIMDQAVVGTESVTTRKIAEMPPEPKKTVKERNSLSDTGDEELVLSEATP